MRLHRPSRPAATTVEFAVVGPLTLMLLMGLLVGGMGVFRYQQVAFLSREASRWAAVHGAQYAQETGQPAATADDVYQKAVLPRATAIDPSRLGGSVTWNSSNAQYRTITVNGVDKKVANTVSVTVSYQWIPEYFWGGITLTSTSVAPMSY
jgi:Flp pilus assembly protein TadG